MIRIIKSSPISSFRRLAITSQTQPHQHPITVHQSIMVCRISSKSIAPVTPSQTRTCGDVCGVQPITVKFQGDTQSRMSISGLPGTVFITLHWRHNDHNGVSNHQPHGCLLNHLFRRRSKKTSKFRVTGLCVGNSPGPVNQFSLCIMLD